MLRVSCDTYRHKTNMNVIREMLPEELLHYCQEHSLLDGVLSPETAPDTGTAATSDYDNL